MAKKRKPAAAKSRSANAAASNKRPAAKARRPAGAAKAAKPVAKAAAKPSESLTHRVAGAFKAVFETLTDAERLHQGLEPDPTRDPDPE